MKGIAQFHNSQFGTIRTIEQDGRVLFCGRDVATALGYENPAKAVRDHARQDGGPIRYPIVDSLGRTQQAIFITEGDLYRLIASSKLPAAQAFESWIFDEVLPLIRKHGGYLTPDMTERVLSDPDTIIRLATDLKAARAQAAELEAQGEADRPKVLFADSVAASQTSILVGDLAKILRGNGVQIGGQRLFAWLRDNGFLIRQKGTAWNMPTQKAMELRLFEVKETAVTHSDGHVTISKTPKVTGKGQATSWTGSCRAVSTQLRRCRHEYCHVLHVAELRPRPSTARARRGARRSDGALAERPARRLGC
ncbi:phage antirepressor KilAC domain-containing protein [Cutibacterium sp.]|uniref:phage antirepressor KilAC domain-containing protein n=1 Tax=Cutibacterium sp. TaxID=1912221 RepID=UPI0026DC8654|nr:phage antirepressor KilAC domain-containing protein [Cutibacterium sp.]MDO4413047.1 phage antirepressor KilAC domain-containing protein [Cutibacterium sp.]